MNDFIEFEIKSESLHTCRAKQYPLVFHVLRHLLLRNILLLLDELLVCELQLLSKLDVFLLNVNPLNIILVFKLLTD